MYFTPAGVTQKYNLCTLPSLIFINDIHMIRVATDNSKIYYMLYVNADLLVCKCRFVSITKIHSRVIISNFLALQSVTILHFLDLLAQKLFQTKIYLSITVG